MSDSHEHNFDNEDPSSHQIVFDNLTLVRHLKEGIHGIVSLYQDTNEQRLLAVKKFYFSESPDAVKTFEREVEALLCLKHPCVLSIICYSLPKPSTPTEPAIPPKIGTLYAERGPLSTILKQIENNQPPDFVNDTWMATTIVGIVLGMRYIHAKKYIHRDLKPENILIDSHGHPLIGDLGSSRFVDLHLTLTKNVGTPLYLAPEMYEEGNYTNLIDVYSFSLILYEILVKRKVFPENIQPAPLMRRVISGTRAEIPESIRPEIREIIERCWAVNPEERFTFDQIYQTLKNIDFKITPNVDSDYVKSYINEIEPQVDIKIRLWNGELYPMTVSLYDRLIDIRKRISERTHIDLENIIPCNGYMPLYCCWNHTLGDDTFFYEVYNALRRDNNNLQQNGIIIELGIKIRIIGNACQDQILCVVPKTVTDLLNDIKRRCFACQYSVKFRREVLIPSDQSILEKGITFNSIIHTMRILNEHVTINQTRIECNLNDSVNDLIMRYVCSIPDEINQFIYLEKNGNRLNEELSLTSCGVVSNDHLVTRYIQADHRCTFRYINDNRTLQLPPNETIASLIRNIGYAFKLHSPSDKLFLFFHGISYYSYSDDTINSSGLLNETYVHVHSRTRNDFNEFFL